MKMQKFTAALTTLALLISATACSSTPNVQEQTLESVTDQVRKILPNCNLETFDLPNGVVEAGSHQDDLMYLVSPVLAYEQDEKLVFKLGTNGQTDYSQTPDEQIVNKYKDKFYVCNSLGTKLAQVSSLSQISGVSPDCHVYDSYTQAKVEQLVRTCGKALDSNTKLGFWVILRYSTNASHLKKIASVLGKDKMEAGYSDYPMLYSGKYLVTLQSPDFDGITLAGIQNVDSVWKKIKQATKFESLGKLVKGYPNSFNRDGDPSHAQGSYFNRDEISATYSALLSATSCNGSLQITELNYSPGDCGKIPFDVFQADLATGDCTFLGDWTDANGKPRIGIVNFCNVYNKATFQEGKSYSIKVRVDGVTSYNTKLGYQNEVLSFTAIK
jgi:hypothetical protein